MRCVFAASVLLILTTAACEPSAPTSMDGWAGTTDTLPSGRVVVHNLDIPLSRAPWTLVERLRLGSLDAEGPTLFGQIGGIALDANGVYVLEPFAHEIRAFSVEGDFVRAFGREGQGPGELTSPSGLATDPDGNLWVLNWGSARYSGFDPADGSVADERRRQISFASFPWAGAFDDAGRLIDIGLNADGEEAILRLDSAFVPTDTLPLPQSPDDGRVVFRRDGRMIASMPDPFAAQVVWKPRPHGGIVVGEGANYRLHRIEFDGDTTLTIQLDRAPVAVRDTERDSAVAAFDEIAATLANAPPDRRPDPRPFKPAHTGLIIDDQDRTWVLSENAAGRRGWDVFGTDGRYLARVATPEGARYSPVAVRGDRIAVIDDSAGVPTVVVYDLVRPKQPD